jgi:hypothetical protein
VSGRIIPGGRAAVRWTFNRGAYAAKECHVHALRWADQTCGYARPDDDPFVNHTFSPGWIRVTFD